MRTWMTRLVRSYRELLERLWPEEVDLPYVDPANYRHVVEFLDAAPPSIYPTIGRWILEKRRRLASGAGRQSGLFSVDGQRTIVFMCDGADKYADGQDFVAELASLTAVRAEEVAEQTGSVKQALGIGQLVGSGFIDYRYVFLRDISDVPWDIKADIQHRFGALDYRRGKARRPKVGRNQPCPCGTGLKFKRCCGM